MLRLLQSATVHAPEPLGTRDLLVAGDQVVWMGEPDTAQLAGLDVERVDLSGLRVIPGLVDCHVHLTGGGGEDGFHSQVPPVPLSLFTRGGTTTVVGVLGTDDTTRGTASLVAAARGMTEQGLSAYCLTGGYHFPPVTLTGSVRGDIVHVDRILGVGELALSDHRSSQPSLDQFLQVVADAHVGGMLSRKAGYSHLHLGDGERGLQLVRQALDTSELPPRVFHPTHVNRRRALFTEALELVERGCTVDVTSFPVAEGEDAWSATDAWLQYRDAGLSPDRLTISSDAGGSLPHFDADGRVDGMEVAGPHSLGDVLAELLQQGVELSEALPAFTSNPARVVGLAKGSIQVGRDADLVVLNPDHSARDVMAMGRWHVREGRQQIQGTFESREPQENS